MSRITTSLRIMLAAALLLFASVGRSSAQDDYGGNATYQQFYDELAPYGEWITAPQYGYVWVPNAGSDFRPYYTNGYWVNSDYGNTWVSDYEWGWAAFHYGRWTYSSYYGWVWIPGSQWGPAWVSWRSNASCYGWAPLGPGVSVNFSFGSGYYVPDYWWTFTPCQYILDRNFHNYSYGPRYNTNYIHQTTILHNTYVSNQVTYAAGPRRGELETAIGRQVHPVSINNFNRPGRAQVQGAQLQMYRPSISESRPGTSERPRSVSAAETPLPANNRAAAGEIDRSRPVFNRSQMNPQVGSPRTADRPVQGQNSNQPVMNGNGIDRSNVQQPARPVRQPRQQQVDMRGQQQQVDQMNQQRVQQMQQQRSQQDQMNQQRAQQQQQMNQQRAQQQQMNQQRAQQQQMNQQRAQQQQMNQQRMQQMQQQRMQQMQQQQRPQQQRQDFQPRREQAPSQPAPEQVPADRGGERHGR